MELKSYQQQALQDLKQYLAYINLYKDYSKAFTQVWADKHVTLGANKPIKPYKNVIPHVPHVCFKIPTGGGKTFVACASVKPIFDALTNTSVKALVWLVPSEAILSQTIKCLKDADHPYRRTTSDAGRSEDPAAYLEKSGSGCFLRLSVVPGFVNAQTIGTFVLSENEK